MTVNILEAIPAQLIETDPATPLAFAPPAFGGWVMAIAPSSLAMVGAGVGFVAGKGDGRR